MEELEMDAVVVAVSLPFAEADVPPPAKKAFQDFCTEGSSARFKTCCLTFSSTKARKAGLVRFGGGIVSAFE